MHALVSEIVPTLLSPRRVPLPRAARRGEVVDGYFDHEGGVWVVGVVHESGRAEIVEAPGGRARVLEAWEGTSSVAAMRGWVSARLLARVREREDDWLVWAEDRAFRLDQPERVVECATIGARVAHQRALVSRGWSPAAALERARGVHPFPAWDPAWE